MSYPTPRTPEPDNAQPGARRQFWLRGPGIMVVIVVAGLALVGAVVGLSIPGDDKAATPKTAALAAESTTPPKASPTPSPTMGYTDACTAADRLLIGDALTLITDFVDDPSLASIDEARIQSVVDRMNAIAPSLPSAVATGWQQILAVILELQTAKTDGVNDTIETGVFANTSQDTIVACGPYVPDGALAGAKVGGKSKPTPKPKPTIGEGIWTVGEDIPAGTYKVTENAGEDCYWARLKPDGDIIDNYLGGGRPKVRIRKGEQFETSGCPIFSKVG